MNLPHQIQNEIKVPITKQSYIQQKRTKLPKIIPQLLLQKLTLVVLKTQKQMIGVTIYIFLYNNDKDSERNYYHIRGDEKY